MTVDNLKLASALKKSVAHYKEVSEFADALETIGQYEQTVAELDRAINLRRTELVNVSNAITTAKAKLAEVDAVKLRDADARAEKILLEANAQAEAHINEAREKSAHLKANSVAVADKKISEASQLELKAQNMLKNAELELKELIRVTERKQIEFDDLDGKFQDVRQKLASILK